MIIQTATRIEPRVEQLLPSQLFVDQGVQRPLDQRRVEKIVGEFDPAALGVLVVSRRTDGTHHVIDGQHRLAVVLAVGRGDTPTDCKVYQGLSREEEAAMFRKLNNTRTVAPIDRFRVRIVEGEPIATAIHRILQKHGWVLRAGKQDYSFAAVAAAEKLYKRSGEDADAVIDRLMWVITEAWSGNSDGVRAELVGGIGALLAHHGEAVDVAKLVARLAEHRGGPRGLVGRARALHDSRGGLIYDAVATILIDEINYKRTIHRLPDWSPNAA